MHKAREAKLRFPVFAGMMRHHLFLDAVISLQLCQERDIAMQFSVKMDMLDNLPAVNLQPTVKIMNIDTGKKSGHLIKETRGNGLRHRIVTGLLPAAHQIQLPLLQLLKHRGNFIRVVLQIRIQRRNILSPGLLKSNLERRAFTVITLHPDAFYKGMIVDYTFHFPPRLVGGAVVHVNKLIAKGMIQCLSDQVRQFRNGLLFVIHGYDNAEFYAGCMGILYRQSFLTYFMTKS